jgi:hypothetical protein
MHWRDALCIHGEKKTKEYICCNQCATVVGKKYKRYEIGVCLSEEARGS